jgi:hypothetical protein
VRLQGQLGRASACYRESFTTRRRPTSYSYSDPETPYIIEGLAATAAAEGCAERAARLFGAAEIWRALSGFPLPPTHRTIYDRDVAAALAQLGDDAFAGAWAAGRALTLDQAIAEALAIDD